MVVTILQIWLIVVVATMLVYTARHWLFTFSRVYGKQRVSFDDAFETDYPAITVLIPMHDEGRVAANCLDAILASDYPADRLTIVPIDDHSEDDTGSILARYAANEPRVHPLSLVGAERGKSNALNAALRAVNSEIVLVFDADYTPGKGLLRALVMAFIDPEVGAVMGRVVPHNTSMNLLTRLLSMERAGGYQVDQQARYNFNLLPQYGGTVGGFRRRLLEQVGGFDPAALAEDTELTASIFRLGWKVVYDNRAECYEEVPETWASRFRQLRRWSRGHHRVLGGHFFGVLFARGLTFAQRLDALLLLFVYAVPPLLLSGWFAALALFLVGHFPLAGGVGLAFAVVLYSTFGNFAPVYQVATAEVLDGSTTRLFLAPYLFYMFPFNTWAITTGFIDSIGDRLKDRRGKWDKTVRSGARV